MAQESQTRSRRRDFLKATGGGAVTTALAGCLVSNGGSGDGNGGTDGSGGTTGTTSGGGGDQGPINVVGLEPMSGVFSIYGPRHAKGARFAAEEINANGGVLGRDIQVNIVDTASSGKAAANAFTTAIEQRNTVAAIGPGASEAAIRARRVAEQNQVPLYLHAAGATAVVPKSARYTFRTALPATPTVARAQANLIAERDYTDIGVIYEDGVWGAEYKAALKHYLPDDITITASDTAPIPKTDFVPILRRFPDNFDIFLGTAHPAGALSIYSQMYEIGMSTDLFLAGISPMVAEYNAIGDVIGKSYSSFNSTDMYSEDYKKVAKTYNEQVGGLFDHPQANGYVCMKLIAEMIRRAGAADPVEIAKQTRTGKFETIYGTPLQWTKWGEVQNSVQIYNAFDVDDTASYWPNGKFEPVEEWRSQPLPAYEPGTLGL